MLVLALAGCAQEVLTEGREILVVADDLKIIGTDNVTAPLLAGTVTCPELKCAGASCPSDEQALACFEQFVSPNAELSDGCFTVPQEGIAHWKFEVRDCDATRLGDYAPTSDQLSFPVLAPYWVAAEATDVEELVELYLEPGEAPFPTDWRTRPADPLRIIAGEPFRFFPLLYERITGIEVGWTFAQGRADASGGIEATWSPSTAAVEVVLEDDQHGEVRFAVGASGSWTLRDVEAAPRDAPASLEVVVAYYRDPFTTRLTPVGARAVVRDAAEGLLWGTPIEWTLDEGHLAIDDPQVTLPGRDYLLLLDECVPPEDNEGPHRALLRATFGDLTATAELAWFVPERPPDPYWNKNEHCVVGQGPPDPTGPTTSTAPTEPTDAVSPEVSEFIAGAGGCGCGGTGSPALLGIVAALAAVRRGRAVRPPRSV